MLWNCLKLFIKLQLLREQAWVLIMTINKRADTFKYQLVCLKSETERLSCSLALNGNSELCFKTMSFAKLSSLRSFALELLKFLRNWRSNLNPYHHKKPFTKRQKAFYSETERFELSVQVTPHNTLAGCRLKPTRPRFLSDNIYNNTNIKNYQKFFYIKRRYLKPPCHTLSHLT